MKAVQNTLLRRGLASSLVKNPVRQFSYSENEINRMYQELHKKVQTLKLFTDMRTFEYEKP